MAVNEPTTSRSTHPASWVPPVKAGAAVLGAVVVAASGATLATIVLSFVVVVLAGFAANPRVRSAIDRSASSRSLRLVLEVVVALAVVAVTGGTASGFLAYLAATVLAAAMGLGRPAGAAAGVLTGLLAAAADPGFTAAFADPATPAALTAILGILGLLGGGEGEGRDPHVVTEALARRRTNEVLAEVADITEAEPSTFDEVAVLDALALQAASHGGRALAFGRVDGLVLTVASWDGSRGSVLVDDSIADETGVPAWRRSLATVWSGSIDGVVAPLARLGVLVDRPATRDDASAVQRADLDLANVRLHRRIRDIGADQERRRLAADLHDGLAQSLAQLRFELDLLATQAASLPPSDVGDRLGRLVRQVERSLGDARHTVTGLRASVASGGLVATIRDYVRDVSALAGPGVRFRAETAAEVDAEAAQAVLLIVQEAMANTLRHAQATVTAVEVVDGPDGGVDVRVDDDGVGFDVDRRAADGIATMESRAARTGLRLRVRSVPGEGSTVTVSIPRGLVLDRDAVADPVAVDAGSREARA